MTTEREESITLADRRAQLDELAQQLARGEITRPEFHQRLAVLRGGPNLVRTYGVESRS